MNKIKICLDAGHYGKYNPSPVVKGYYESDMNWKLHNLLKKYLEQYGIEVIRTRNDQAADLGLTTRGNRAKGCDLFLSIHSNASTTESTDAPLAIVALSGKADALGQKLADCVASAMDTRQAGKIWKRKNDSGGEWYGVLRGAAAVNVPGIILEHSYHTNTKATQWLMEDKNLDKLAQAEAGVIAEYFGVGETQLKVTEKELDYTVGMRYLREGCEGEDVRALQILLKAKGYDLGAAGPNKDGVDGKYGPKTKAAVQCYQHTEKLEEDGVAGYDTMSHMLGLKVR